MSDTDNTNNGSENNTNNTDTNANTPVNNPAPETPATETPKTEEVKPEAAPVEAPKPATEPAKEEAPKSEDLPIKDDKPATTEPTTAKTDDIAIENNIVAFSVSGNLNVSGKVPKGTTLKDAVAKLGGSVTNLTLRDEKNNVITHGSAINNDMKLTASTRASGA